MEVGVVGVPVLDVVLLVELPKGSSIHRDVVKIANFIDALLQCPPGPVLQALN